MSGWEVENPGEIWQKLNLNVERFPPKPGSWEKGFVGVEGNPEAITHLVLSTVRLGGYGAEEGYLEKNAVTNLKKVTDPLRNDASMDLEVPNEMEPGQKWMIRIMKTFPKNQSNMRIQFGGGGNSTPFESMVKALDKTALIALNDSSNPLGVNEKRA